MSLAVDFSGIWIRPFAVSGDKSVLRRLSDGLEMCPSYLQIGLQLEGIQLPPAAVAAFFQSK